MKRIILLLVLVAGMAGISSAQKFAFVDTDYILNNIPAYKAAQTQLDKLSADYQAEVEEKFKQIDQMYKDYQAEKVLLSEPMRVKKEEEIVKKEKEARDFQRQYFGQDGDLFKRRQELVKPIQDDIYNAVKALATEGGYAVIFDSAAGLSMLYTNPRNDKSDEVLERLGYKK
jgi:outer membrane protein